MTPDSTPQREAHPVEWKSLGVRWDKVEHYLVKMSDGSFIDRHEHIEMNLPYNWLSKAKYNSELKR